MMIMMVDDYCAVADVLARNSNTMDWGGGVRRDWLWGARRLEQDLEGLTHLVLVQAYYILRIYT